MTHQEESSIRTALYTRGPQPIARAFHRYLFAPDDRHRAPLLLGYVDTGMRFLVSLLAIDVLGAGVTLPDAARTLFGRKSGTPSLGDWSRALVELAMALPEAEWSLPTLRDHFGQDGALTSFLKEVIEDRNRYFHRAVPGFVGNADAKDFLRDNEPGARRLSLALRTLVDYPLVRLESNVRDDNGTKRATMLRLTGLTPHLVRGVPGISPDVDLGCPLVLSPNAGRTLRLDPFLRIEERGCEVVVRVVARIEGEVWYYDDPGGGDATSLGPPTPLAAALAGKTSPAPAARFRQTDTVSDEAFRVMGGHQHAVPVEVPGFKLGKVIGFGGTSTVYLAERLLAGRMPGQVALKVLHPTVVAEPTLRDRFANEFVILQRLQHPVTVRTYDYLPAEHVLVLEYVDGTDLHSSVTRTKPLAVEQAAKVCINVLEALEEAHNADIIHRDVKAANVMVEKDGGRYRLLDFGLARWDSGHTLTTTGDFFGTLAYIAPEQYKSAHDIDHRVDLFSVGRLFQFLITGRLSDSRDDVPSAADALIRRATQQDREHRYPNARAMIEAFEERLNSSWTGQPLEPGEKLAQSFLVGRLSGETKGVYAYQGEATDTGESVSLLAGSTPNAERTLLDAIRRLTPGLRAELGNPRVLREASKRAYVIAGAAAEPAQILVSLLEGRAPARPAVAMAPMPSRVPPFLAWVHAAAQTWGGPQPITPVELLQGAEYTRRALVACSALIAARAGRLGLVRTRSDAVTETLGGALELIRELEQLCRHEPWWAARAGVMMPDVQRLKWLARDRNLLVHGREHDVLDASNHVASLAALIELGGALADGFDWRSKVFPVLVTDALGGWHLLDIHRGGGVYLALMPGVARIELDDEARVWLAQVEVDRGVSLEGARIEWKGAGRRIPSGSNDPILASAPHPMLTRYLAGLVAVLTDMPTVPLCGYAGAAHAARVNGIPALSRQLKAIQLWCQGAGVFDLSAIIVTRYLEPGAQHFGSDCADPGEWREYVRAAIDEIARRRPASTPSSAS